jgi:hypothetical protein
MTALTRWEPFTTQVEPVEGIGTNGEPVGLVFWAAGHPCQWR